MTRHAAVAELVRRRCPDADVLLEMLGCVDEDGALLPDDDRDYGDVDTAQLGSRAHADKVVSIYDDIRVRPKVSTAPEALRDLPPVVKSPTPKRRSAAQNAASRANGAKAARNLAPCGTPGAKRRHKRRGEPVCALCEPVKLTDKNGAERKRAKRRATGVAERPITCGTRAGYQKHRRNGEKSCRPCQEADNAYNRAKYAKKLGRPVMHRSAPRCGTISGAKTHRVREEQVCDQCKEAERAYGRARYAEKRAA